MYPRLTSVIADPFEFAQNSQIQQMKWKQIQTVVIVNHLCPVVLVVGFEGFSHLK